MKPKNILYKYKWILSILFVSFALRLFYFKDHNVWWDSAVYVEMGKYIFSLGNAGLWEASRALVWPIILGFFWKLNLDSIFFGKILLLLFGLGSILFTYLISKKVFNEKIALLSALMLGLSPTFFFFNSILLTAIPSTFFALLGVYFFINKKNFSAGLFLGIAFMTRFLQLGIVFCVSLIILYNLYKKKTSIKNILYFSLGFFIPLIPFLIFNFIKYSNIIYPFLLQNYMTQNTGWPNHQPFNFYFINILKENFLSIFAIFGVAFSIQKPNHKKTLLLIIPLLFFIYHSLINQKEMRFIITFLPYFSILTSYGLYKFYTILKKYLKTKQTKSIFRIFFIILTILWCFNQGSNLFVSQPRSEYTTFHEYVDVENVEEGVWITNPEYLIYSDKKADLLIYFPTFDTNRAEYLTQKTEEAQHILLNTCDIPCPPSDSTCELKKLRFINKLKQEFNNIHYESNVVCEEYIFSKTSS